MVKKDKPASETLTVSKIEQEVANVYIVGESPLLLQRLSEKAKRELLYPAAKKNAVERSTTLKHDPRREFGDAPHRLPDGPTLLALPAAAFKRAMSQAAIDLPGVEKSVIGRLTFVLGTGPSANLVPVYGQPFLYMDAVRSADMKRTPDIRTWVILPEWATTISVNYVRPNLTGEAVANLLGGAGIFVGVGDGRPEKGKLSFGRFRTVRPNDPDYLRIVRNGGRKTQEAGMSNPRPYNDDVAELLAWFDAELKRRQPKKAVAA